MSTNIICRAISCVYNEDKICTSDRIVYDPEEGCLTYEEVDDIIDIELDLDEEDEDEWDDDELFEEDDEEEDDLFLDDLEYEDDDVLRL